MKKIAIVTITNGGLNFGNRLQNYALQCALESFSLDVETIFSFKNYNNNLFLSIIRRWLKFIVKSSGRAKCFNSFNKKYIRRAKRYRYDGLNDDSFNDDYNIFIAGSDQIWNPYFHFNSDFEFLTFADQNKRFSYAASFGADDIPDEYKTQYAKKLTGMKHISVREDRAREIVKELTNCDADVHIDPTMLLDAEHYAALEIKPDRPLPEKYLLVYFLGFIKPEYSAYINNVSNETNLPVLELSESINTPFYHTGPQQFIYLLRHADYICTDSYHGTIFSIIFTKSFTTFCRNGSDMPMMSRIETLLSKFGLQNRLYDAHETIKTVAMSYENVNKILSIERTKAMKYLRGIVSE